MTLTQEQLAEFTQMHTTIGASNLCDQWMYSAIRHCERNMDFEIDDQKDLPDRQCGGEIARLLNAVPTLIAMAEQSLRYQTALTNLINVVAKYSDGIGEHHSLAIGLKDARAALENDNG